MKMSTCYTFFIDINISFTDFQKLDIRIGTIMEAVRVEESERLIKLTVDIGIEVRELVAGIGEVVQEPNILIGKQIPILVNLEPKTIRGIQSQGMILAVDHGGVPILLHPERDVMNGSVVR
jgi:methionine--tRNA ligase beta chain